MGHEKQGRIVAIIETVFTVILGIVELILIIFAAVAGSAISVAATEISRNNQGGSYNVHATSKDASIFVIGLAIPVIILGIVFLVNLGLLILLWKAVNNKSHGKCSGWYITQSVFISLDLIVFIISWFVPLPWYYYLLKMIGYSYRIWSIHVIKSLGDEILLRDG